MERFHVNWNTGMPARCTKYTCEEKFHSPEAVDCARHYEQRMVRFTIPAGWTRTNRPPR